MIDCLVLADDSRDAKGKKSGGIAQVGWLIGAKLRFGETLLVREISPQLLEFSDPSSGSTMRQEDLPPLPSCLKKGAKGSGKCKSGRMEGLRGRLLVIPP